MPYIATPGDTTSQLLTVLSDPKTAKANILELQSMSEQLQRDQKKSSQLIADYMKLEQSVLNKEAEIAEREQALENRRSSIFSREASLDKRADQTAKQEMTLGSQTIVLDSKEKELSSREEHLRVKETSLDNSWKRLSIEQAKLAQDKKEHDEWQLSISSILSSKP